MDKGELFFPSHHCREDCIMSIADLPNKLSSLISSAKNPPTRTPNRFLRFATLTTCYLAAYLVLHHVGMLQEYSGGISPWYPPPGLHIVFLLLVGLRYAPVIAIGFVLVNTTTALAPIGVRLMLGTTCACVYTLAAYLLKQKLPNPRGLQSIPQIVWFLAVAIASPLLVATINVSTLMAFGIRSHEGFWPDILNWWVGDAIGIIVLTPFLMTNVIPWLKKIRAAIQNQAMLPASTAQTRRRGATNLECLAMAAAIAAVAAFPYAEAWWYSLPIDNDEAYLAFIPLIWISLRFGVAGSAIAALSINAGTMLLTTVYLPIWDNIANQQFFMFVMSAMGLLLGAAVDSNQKSTQSLLESRVKAHRLVESSIIGVHISDTTGRIHEANDAFLNMLGYTREDLDAGLIRWDQMTPPEYRHLDEAARQQLKEKGEATPWEKVYVRKDGRRIWVHIGVTALKREADVIHCVCFTHDVTARKQAERSLRLSLFSTDRAVDPIFWVDPHATILYVNDAACRTLGYAREELIGKTVHDIDPNFPPEAWPAHWEELKKRGSFTLESSHLTKDGRTIQTEVTVNYIQHEGLEFNCATMRDVTEQKRAQNKLQFMQFAVDRADESIFWIDKDASILYVNDAACRTLGYAREELLTKTVADIDPLYQADAWPDHWDELRRKGSLRFESLHRDKNGNVYSVEVIANHIVFGDREYNLSLTRDVSARKQAEQALQREIKLNHLLRHITLAANEASCTEQALHTALRLICETTGWPVGHVYFPSDDNPELLLPSTIWHMNAPKRFETFHRVTESTPLPSGKGLPGRVLATGKPLWITNLAADPNFPRARLASDIGVKAGFAFPITLGSEVAAVLEFFSDSVTEPDNDLLDVLGNVGTQLGRVIERENALRAVQASHRAYEDLVHSIKGVVWEADAETFRFTFVSHGAKDLLGYPVERWTSNPGFWENHIHPDDREQAVRNCIEHTRSKSDADFEYRMIAADGRVVWIKNIIKVVVENDRPVKIRGVMIDVTKHKQSLESLEQSEQSYRFLYENNPSMYFTVSRDGAILSVNRFGAEQLGYTSSELIGKPVIDVFFEEDKPSVRQCMAQCFDNPGQTARWEFRKVTKNGDVMWVKELVRILPDQDGRLIALIVCEDVTDRKRAESFLANQASILENLAAGRPLDNVLSDLILMLENHAPGTKGCLSRLDKASGALLNSIGSSLPEASITSLNRPFIELLNAGCAEAAISCKCRIVADDTSIDPLFGKIRNASSSHHFPSCWCQPIISSKDEVLGVIALHFHTPQKPEPGEIQILETAAHVAGIALEHHQAKEALRNSEEQVRLLLDSTAEAIYGIDLQGNCTFANPSCLRLLGYQNMSCLLGKNMHRLIHVNPDGSPTPVETCLLYQVLETGVGTHSDNEVFRKADGALFPVEYWSYPIRRNGEIIGAVSTFLDVSDRKKIEKRQAMIMRELDHRVKNNLAAVVALCKESIHESASLHEFEERFTGRIAALSRTHTALALNKWEGVKLKDLVALTLQPYLRDEGDKRIECRGPNILLPANAASPLSMSLHEMVTNAAKYGSLSTSRGSIKIAWSKPDEKNLSLRWSEFNGPVVVKPTHTGLGTDLIKGFINYELNGNVDFDFAPSGLNVNINLRIQQPGPRAAEQEPHGQSFSQETPVQTHHASIATPNPI